LELRENKKMKLLAGFLGLSAGNIVYPSDFDFPSGKVFTIKNIRQAFLTFLRSFWAFSENL